MEEDREGRGQPTARVELSEEGGADAVQVQRLSSAELSLSLKGRIVNLQCRLSRHLVDRIRQALGSLNLSNSKLFWYFL